jgi:anti-anti-sigma factor
MIHLSVETTAWYWSGLVPSHRAAVTLSPPTPLRGKEIGGLLTIYCDEDLALCVIGEVDVSNADQFAAALGKGVVLGQDIRLELSELTFIDSAGLYALVHSAKALARSGGRLVLASPSAVLLRLLELTAIVPNVANIQVELPVEFGR